MFFFKRRHHQPTLPFHTDMHCHVVPGVDDGAPDASTAADLVERMHSWGITRIISTPHVTQGTYENTPDILDTAQAELNDELERRGLDLRVERSAEYRIDAFFNTQLEKGLVTPYPGGFILVENDFMQEPHDLDQFLFDLKTHGYRPILAHPERYVYYAKTRPYRYGQIYRSGTFLQVNILSLAGYYGKEERKIAEHLLERGYIDFLATDLHNHRHADKIEEFISTRSFERIAAKLKILNDTSFPQ